MKTRGGAATYVRTMQRTPLWSEWRIRHVATHRDGSVPARIATFVAGAAAFARELVVRRPDVVHLHTSSYGSFARKSLLAWVSRWARLPVVLHVHGGAFGDFYDRSPAAVRRYIRTTLERVDAVIALGDSWAGVLRQIAPGARLVVVPNAVKPAAPVGQPAAGDRVHVLFLGDVEDHKGAFLLLEAWGRLVEQTSPGVADLVVAGSGQVSRARSRVQELGLAEQVQVTGWIEPTKVETLLTRSHVLVLPSRYEGQPMAVLEAMAHGLCVVATDVGGIPDLLGDCGVLVPPDDVEALTDALRLVILDAERRASFGARGFARVQERFDVDTTWRALAALYEELSR